MMRWKVISELNEEYEVSEFGDIRNLSTGKILKPIKAKTGYLVVNISTKTIKRKQCLIHRLVAKEFLPQPMGKEHVNHRDGNKKNNEVSNLEWVTPAENIRHAIDNGLEKQQKVTTEMKKKLKNIDNWEELNEISKKVGISSKGLRKYTKLKIKAKPLKEEIAKREEEIFNTYLEVKNVSEVARRMNTTRDIVARILSQNGIAKRPDPRRIIVDKELVLKKLIDTGGNKAEAARLCNISRSVVYRIAREANWTK